MHVTVFARCRLMHAEARAVKPNHSARARHVAAGCVSNAQFSVIIEKKWKDSYNYTIAAGHRHMQ